VSDVKALINLNNSYFLILWRNCPTVAMGALFLTSLDHLQAHHTR